ncbi:MAG: EAL domain-containing protein [Citrobacter telavivensis]
MNQHNQSTLSEFSVSEALSRQSFVPYFQPVHDSVSGKPVGAEMLARMVLPDGQVVSPGLFLPYVMAAGKMTAVTQQLLEKASDGLRAHRGADPFSLSFNVFPDMLGEDWLKDACVALQQAGVAVVVELTENLPLTLSRQVLQRSLAMLREAGVKVALDDFGTGYSGHLRLQQTGADIIKIPREFISDLQQCNVSYGITHSIIHLASRLDLRVVAEGVETRPQVDELLLMGVSHVQGFYYSEPLSYSSLGKYMKCYAGAHNNRATAAGFH